MLLIFNLFILYKILFINILKFIEYKRLFINISFIYFIKNMTHIYFISLYLYKILFKDVYFYFIQHIYEYIICLISNKILFLNIRFILFYMKCN